VNKSNKYVTKMAKIGGFEWKLVYMERGIHLCKNGVDIGTALTEDVFTTLINQSLKKEDCITDMEMFN